MEPAAQCKIALPRRTKVTAVHVIGFFYVLRYQQPFHTLLMFCFCHWVALQGLWVHLGKLDCFFPIIALLLRSRDVKETCDEVPV